MINADSAQLYKDLCVVTARPSQLDEARIPHRLYGYRDGARPCSAAEWAADARTEIEAAHAAGRMPVLVGGSGLYIRTLIDGIAPVPPIDGEVRAEVRSLAVAEAFAALRREDPQAAARIGPGDRTRVARALEVVRSTGRTLADWQQERSGGMAGAVRLVPIILLPPRDWLYARCDDRFEKMTTEEGVDEVRSLLARGLDPSLPVMRAIGVAEIAAMLRGEVDREEALRLGRIATRQYAKRQYTWFSRQPPAEWPRFQEPLDCGGMANALAQIDAGLSR